MSAIRYSSSFIISSIVYIVIVSIYFNIMDRPKSIQKPKEHRIKIAIITPPTPPKIEPKPIIKPTPPPPPIVVKKPKIKKVIKKHKHKHKKIIKIDKRKHKPKHKRKKIIKHKKVVKRPKIITQPTKIIKKQKVVQIIKPYIEPYIEPIIKETPTPIQTKVVARVKPTIKPSSQHKDNLSAKKRKFLKDVRDRIYTNKRYPALARRRNIQGRVHVVFDILANGEATNIRIDDTPRVLKKEVRRSIRKSFPIDIPSAIASMFPMRNISVNIDFRLE